MALDAAGGASRISDDVLPASGRDVATLPYRQRQRLSTGPDARYLLWLGGNPWDAVTRVMIGDLESGARVTLLARAAPSVYSFYDAVIWVH